MSGLPLRSLPARAGLLISASGRQTTSRDDTSFSEVVCKPLFVDNEFALCLACRIDQMFLTEQELLCDSEVCGTGRMAANLILDGADIDLTISRAKADALKLESEAVESLMVRFDAREDAEVPISLLQREMRVRRQRATSKLFDWFERVKRAQSHVDEAKKMEVSISGTLRHIESRYLEIAAKKTELSMMFYDLQEALQELLRARSEILMPRLRKLRMRMTQKTV